jgi:hypothetical protein
MASFIDFLLEAQFSDDEFQRVMSVFSKKLPRLLGSKLYRYGGDDYIETANGQKRIVWLFDDRAFGVRFKNNRVLGIDVWTKYALNTEPSHFIDIHELTAPSLIGSIKKLADLIKNPAEGEYEVHLNLAEQLQLNEMARRVSPNDFYQLLVQRYGEEGAKRLTWDNIRSVADENDVLIPAYIRAQKIDRGLWSGVPSDKPEDEPAKKKDPILFIKVTAQDPDTKRFLPAAEVKQAQQLYQQIQDQMMGPHKPTEKELRDPETLYGHLAQLVGMTCDGHLRSLLVYGGPGTGKTHTIMQVINDKGLVKGKDYQKLSGKATPVEIYKILFMYRNNGLVVFDDLDSMWGNEDATNILKAALDTSKVREISWVSSQTVNVSKMSDEMRKALFDRVDRYLNGETDGDDSDGVDDEEGLDDNEDNTPIARRIKARARRERDRETKRAGNEKVRYPSTFDFTGKVIFISNLKREDFDSAIMSRTAKINMDLTPDELLQRMRNILPTLGGDDVSVDRKSELLDHLLDMHKRQELDAVTMREFIKGLNILRSGAPNWKDLLVYM